MQPIQQSSKEFDNCVPLIHDKHKLDADKGLEVQTFAFISIYTSSARCKMLIKHQQSNKQETLVTNLNITFLVSSTSYF